MKIAFYNSKDYDREFFSESNKRFNHQLTFFTQRLDNNSVDLCVDHDVVCVFVNDVLDKEVLKQLSKQKVKLIALRCAGYDNIDIDAARDYGIDVIRVSDYSPSAVAEHALGLMLALNRHICQASEQVRVNNFSIENLLGFDFAGKTIGIIGMGKIGSTLARITQAMGMRVIAYDSDKSLEFDQQNIELVDFEYLLKNADVVSIHCPLTKETKHLINTKTLSIMKNSAMLINTSRGQIIDTCAVVDALKSKQIAYLGIDVYENEKNVFFEDLSCEDFSDQVLTELTNMPNVLMTSHQGFFTKDALTNIANTTLSNAQNFQLGKPMNENDVLV